MINIQTYKIQKSLLSQILYTNITPEKLKQELLARRSTYKKKGWKQQMVSKKYNVEEICKQILQVKDEKYGWAKKIVQQIIYPILPLQNQIEKQLIKDVLFGIIRRMYY